MSFEDDMYEYGYTNEEDFLESLMDLADAEWEKQQRMQEEWDRDWDSNNKLGI